MTLTSAVREGILKPLSQRPTFGQKLGSPSTALSPGDVQLKIQQVTHNKRAENQLQFFLKFFYVYKH